MVSPEERLAMLEVRLDDQKADLAEIKKTMEEIKADLARYKGWVGGVVFVVSSLFAVLLLVKDWIIK